ncbi:ketose-bisphosphate aldolase [Halalkalibacter sp. AB-rgal2]|uniref:class II fructose-bisphosphate aldolase n=1 Tax=Halalkalibacter sp. AB-rgal2 TaxID=3242695 RepID=UPI00359DD7B4
MGLANLNDVLIDISKKKKAVGAFNAHILDMIPTLVELAEQTKSPFIIQITEETLRFSGLKHVLNVARRAIEEVDTPIVLHYDHGKNIDRIKECIDAGFTSVMYDGSKLSFYENVKNTIEVVQYAHQYGVTVEAELGHVGMANKLIESEAGVLTIPEEAKEFVEHTSIDALAVAIGTAHGIYKGPVQLDIDRLMAIRKQVSIPLVLHGGSGVNEAELTKAIDAGISKVNIASELKAPWAFGLKEFIQSSPHEIDPRKILKPALEKYEHAVYEKLCLLKLIDHEKKV